MSRKIGKSLKKKWNAYLERLTKANEKSFGSGSLDCCDLNSNKKNNMPKKSDSY
ncbi:MAG: hypothetical protein KAQ69_12430 [Spirochaetales bacterium]|nr:hypothetical protein [Spirochaetales bacterium]